MADSDVGKLFVGGITCGTSEVTLRDYFSKYGDVSFSIIAKDRLTGVPRGFGFVTFSDPSCADKALFGHHVINGRKVEVKRALPRSEQQPNYVQIEQHQHLYQQQQQQQQSGSQIHSQMSKFQGRNSNGRNGSYGAYISNQQQTRAKKIFVGGLSADLSEEEFRNYFEKFGTITDVVVMHDNNTHRPRGFGFITFDSEEVVEKIMQKSHHELAGKRVEVKRAVPREATRNSYNGNNPRFGGGSFSSTGYSTEESYWPRGPTYGTYPGQLAVSTSYPGYYCSNGGVYSGAYPVGAGYGVYNYGMPVVSPRGPWSGVSLMPGRPVNYGTGFYPSGVNTGFPLLGMVNPYTGFIDHGAHPRVSIKDATPPANGAKGEVNVKRNSRAPDAPAQPNVPPSGQSS